MPGVFFVAVADLTGRGQRLADGGVAVHNHPSADPTPSAAGMALTVEIVASCVSGLF
jgi:hypothetical protein